jgi:hypothetical protein
MIIYIELHSSLPYETLKPIRLLRQIRDFHVKYEFWNNEQLFVAIHIPIILQIFILIKSSITHTHQYFRDKCKDFKFQFIKWYICIFHKTFQLFDDNVFFPVIYLDNSMLLYLFS